MSAVELAIEKLKACPKPEPGFCWDWLASLNNAQIRARRQGALSVRGFARRFNPQLLTTGEVDENYS